MPLHDYECTTCGSLFEAMVDAEQRELACPTCRGLANRVYRRFGGMLGKNKGNYPYFDVQLGCTLESSQHRDRVAKERGLVPMGVDEFNRSRNAPRSPDPWEASEPTPEFVEQVKRDWDDVQFGRVPVETEETRVKQAIETQKAIENSDYLDSETAKIN